MQPVTDTEFRIERVPESAPEQTETSRIWLHGQRTDIIIDGAWLEACLRVGNRYLAFLTHDCPFEESLSIHLLDQTLKPLDGIGMGLMYTTGHFRNLTPETPDRLHFDFYDDNPWYLQIREQPEWRLPGTDPIGSRRIQHGRCHRYLDIQHQSSRGLIPNTRARYHKLRQYWHKIRNRSDHNKSSVK